MAEKTNYDLYSDYWAEINKRELSNSENFDKAILSLSSAGLAFSLTFIKFVVPLENIKDPTFLYWTWYLFGASIILTIISFLISQKALRVSLDYADKCFNQNNEEFCNKKSWWGIGVDILNFIVGVVFISAVISVIMFTNKNFDIKDNNMSDDNKELKITTESARTPVMQTNATRGANVPSMQRPNTGINVTGGANVPTMKPSQPTEESSSTTEEK